MPPAHPFGKKQDLRGQGMSGEAPKSGGGQPPTDPPVAVQVPTSIHVFISYASQDVAVADAIVGALEGDGLKCWIAPRDVTPGEFYADAIVRALNSARTFVLVLSENAAASAHVLREVERASAKRHSIISFRIGSISLSPALEYFLSASQWLDASASGYDRALPKLVEAVQRLRTSPVVDTGQPTALAPPPRSVAVLPFLDMSKKKDQEYFADGIAEEIINLLAQVPDLRVPARTSSFYFKGMSTKVPDIARELGVAHLLEGSIRRSGNQIRVTAQLIRADNGLHLWSQTYDRDARDVFKVQDDIANAVVQALQITLMGGPLTRRKGGTQNLEAYQLYLRGLSSMWQNTRPSLAAASDYFDQAIKLDPDFGLASAEQARNTLFLTNNGTFSPKEGYGRARQLAQHALQVSPDLPDAHGILVNIHRNFDWNWGAAAAEVRQALTLDPTNPTALTFAGQLSYTLGRWDDAERQLRLSLVRDPLRTITIWSLGTAQYGARRFADADATYRRLLEVAPGFLWTRSYLGKTLLAEGKPEAALAMVQQEDDEENRLVFLPIALQAVGRKAEADEVLKGLIAKFAHTKAYWVAMTYANLGDHDLALQWLERAYTQKETKLIEIVGEALFRNLANDPRYKAFLRKMNLPE
jgi:adenylate cyclase